ncbi:hypothetical protein EBS43_08755 [bacterium]|nr:hypothetical protein [bacterium]
MLKFIRYLILISALIGTHKNTWAKTYSETELKELNQKLVQLLQNSETSKTIQARSIQEHNHKRASKKLFEEQLKNSIIACESAIHVAKTQPNKLLQESDSNLARLFKSLFIPLSRTHFRLAPKPFKAKYEALIKSLETDEPETNRLKLNQEIFVPRTGKMKFTQAKLFRMIGPYAEVKWSENGESFKKIIPISSLKTKEELTLDKFEKSLSSQSRDILNRKVTKSLSSTHNSQTLSDDSSQSTLLSPQAPIIQELYHRNWLIEEPSIEAPHFSGSRSGTFYFTPTHSAHNIELRTQGSQPVQFFIKEDRLIPTSTTTPLTLEEITRKYSLRPENALVRKSEILAIGSFLETMGTKTQPPLPVCPHYPEISSLVRTLMREERDSKTRQCTIQLPQKESLLDECHAIKLQLSIAGYGPTAVSCAEVSEDRATISIELDSLICETLNRSSNPRIRACSRCFYHGAPCDQRSQENVSQLLKKADDYFSTFRPQPKNPLSEKHKTQSSFRNTLDSLLSEYPDIVIGENHSEIAAKKALIDNMDLIKASGAEIALEHVLYEPYQAMLDSYILDQSTIMPPQLKLYLETLDRGHRVRDSKYGFKAMVEAARKHQVRLIAFHTQTSYRAGQTIYGSRGVPRWKAMNYMNKVITDHERQGKKLIHFVGNAHNNTRLDVPGVSELHGNAPSLVISEGKSSQKIFNVNEGDNGIKADIHFIERTDI